MKLLLVLVFTLILVGCFVASRVPFTFTKDLPSRASEVKATAQKPPDPVAASSPAPIIKQSRVRRPVTETHSIDESTDISKQLFKASMAFVMPDSANVRDVVRAQLLIDPSKETMALEKELSAKGNKTSGKIRVSKIVIAKLVAPDFKVEPVTPEEQAITMTEPTEWNWVLDPQTTGLLSVNLSVVAVVNVDGDSTAHHLKTFDKTVKIEITPKQRIIAWAEKYWQWFFSTLIVPLIVWIYKQKTKKDPTEITD